MAKQAETRAPKLFEPWATPDGLTVVEVAAIKALFAGMATEHQQKVGMAFIVNNICGYGEEQFCPGEDGRRATDYALGKRRVATALQSILHADISKFKDPDSAPTEQPNRRL
jgi:hypothetical protein